MAPSEPPRDPQNPLDPFDPFDPLDPFDPSLPDLPPDTLPNGPEMVEALDPDLPLVLFPVRLATRFERPEPGADPTHLLVRIFPDMIHADGHINDLTEVEVTIAQSYWERIWRAATDATMRLDAHHWIAGQIDAPRAWWVAEQMAPTNLAKAPYKPIPFPATLAPEPTFPTPQIRTESRPTLARLLPDRWCIIARENVEYSKRVWSRPVKHDLAMAPNLADMPETGDINDFLRAQELMWMVDFPTAVRAGMAVRMRLPDTMTSGIHQLLVFGVRADDDSSAEELSHLLDAQRFTQGLGFLEQGTPTNNTDTVASAWTEQPSDLEAFLGPLSQSPGDTNKQLEPPITIKPPTTAIGSTPSAEAVGLAFGLDGSGGLEAADGFDVVHTAWPRAMNRIMWPATIGYVIKYLLTTGGTKPLDDAECAWADDWFRNWVLGPGLMPTLRVGSQPYGLLPVMRRPRVSTDIGTGYKEGLRSILKDMESGWTFQAPNFSPTRLDEPPTPEEEAVRLAAVLGAVPHPIDFRLRAAADERTRLTSDWADAITQLEDGLFDDVPNEVPTEYYLRNLDVDLRDGAIQDQRSALWALRAEADFRLDNPAHEEALLAVIAHIDEVMLPMTAAHQLRSEVRHWDDRFSGAALDDPDDPLLWYLEYGDDGSDIDGTFPTLRLVPDLLGQASTVVRLHALADDARSIEPLSRPVYVGQTEESLFIKLAEHAVMYVDSDEAEALATAFDALADLVEAADPDTVMEELERTLRETLGVVSHRWDAWTTSLANERLNRMRLNRGTGVQIGGFGWLLEIVPDEGGNDSQGYIHAPSLDHAVTAAILRSAWLAYADEIDDAPFSVDLSSDRVRRATWLLDGVRNGMDLGELLGSRFERRLHDHGLSDLIHDVRVVVAEEAGINDPTAHAIVDGLALAVAYSSSTSNDPVRIAIDDLRITLPGYPADELLVVLEDTVTDLDATADLLTAQAVHSVAKGNLAEAASVLSLAGSGATSVPEIRMPNVHRESRPIEHRVAAVLAARAPQLPTESAGEGLASIAEPTLTAWLTAVLPDVAGVTCDIQFDDGSEWTGSLADAGITAYHVVATSSAGGDLATGRLEALLVARARFTLGVAADVVGRLVTGPRSQTLADVAVVAGAVRSAVGAARPLRAADLVDSGTIAEADVSDLDTRRSMLVEALTELLDHPGDDTILTAHFADLMALDVSGLIAALSASVEDRPALIAKLRERAETSLAILAADFETDDPDNPEDQLARISAAVDLAVPVAPIFEPANRTDLIAAFDDSPTRIGSPLHAMSWLLQTGRVHDGVGRCATAIDLAEILRPDLDVAYQVAQFPDVARAPWVAFARPVDGIRLAFLAVTDAASALRHGPISGVLFDAWTEPVPGSHATTGVAVHFDRPGAQPPQAVLFAVVESSTAWDVNEIEVILEQTLELAVARAIGPETLRTYGHTLPAIHLGESVVVAKVDEPGLIQNPPDFGPVDPFDAGDPHDPTPAPIDPSRRQTEARL